MLTVKLRTPSGETSCVVRRFAVSSPGGYTQLAEFLDSALPSFWEACPADAQRDAWCAECARCDNAGVVIVTRQEAQGDLVGAALARQTMYPHEAELVVNVATQQPAQVRDVQLEALRLVCARMGLVLGRAETKRIWVAL